MEVQSWQETQRRQAEEAMRQSEALYHSLVEMLPLQVWCKDLESRFTFANRGFCAATGRSLSDLIGKTDFDLFPTELAEKYRQDDQRVLASGQTFEDLEEHLTAKGEKLHVHVVKRPIFDGHGQIIGTQGIFWDVTDRKRLQIDLDRVTAELAATKAQLQQLGRTMADRRGELASESPPDSTGGTIGLTCADDREVRGNSPPPGQALIMNRRPLDSAPETSTRTKGSRMIPEKPSRRRFMGQGLTGLASLGVLGWHAGFHPAEAEPATPDVGTMIDRAVKFLRPRQDAKGGWSTQREPGITALVVTALLRSGQVPPGDPMVTRALRYLEGFIGPKGGLSEAPHANYSTSIALVAFQQANLNGRYDRVIKAGQDFLKIDAVGRDRRESTRRRLLRRGGLRRRQQPARPLEHGLLHGGPARHGPACR